MKDRYLCPPTVLLIGGLLAFPAPQSAHLDEPVFDDREQEAIQQIIEDHLVSNARDEQ